MDSTQLSDPPRPHARPRGTVEMRETVSSSATAQGQDAPKPADHDDWGEVTKPRKLGMVIVAILVIAALGALFATGFIPRVSSKKELETAANAAENGPILVAVVQAKRAATSVSVALPGTLRPWQEVSVFARSTGYLKKWYADISNHVTQGQLLAEIDTPEVDQQLLQAAAAVLQMEAAQEKAASDVQIAQVTNNRFLTLKGTSSVTQQDLDQKAADLSSAQANLNAARANVTAAEANVKRLSEMKAFEKVIAPFEGVITGRAYDTGALIHADPTDTNIKPMYKIAENDILRVFVNVPQTVALTITRGMDVKVTARERPGHVFEGKVMGTTNYLDPSNRSLLTEIKVPNQDGSLLPGMYVSTTFSVTRDKPPLIIPSPALIANADGTQVAIVKDGKIEFRQVKIGEDFGNTLEITTGLDGSEQIISTPGEKIVAGREVKIVASEK